MKKRKTMIRILTAVSILACLASGCGSSRESAAPETASSPDETEASGELTPFTPPIRFDAEDTNGETVSADIFADSRLTMVNVWATYCNPCLMEMPYLGELASEYSSEDFQIIGIISDVLEDDEEARNTAISLIEETGADYTHLLLNESLYTAMLTDVTAVPTTFFVDSDGQILDTVIGAMEKDAWKETIDAYLEE